MKEICQDWKAHLSMLYAYKPNKFIKRVGPFLLGVELLTSRFGGSYTVYHEAYPLWIELPPGAGAANLLNIPAITKIVLNRKGLDFTVNFSLHDHYFKEISALTMQQALFPLDKNVNFSELVTGVTGLFGNPRYGVLHIGRVVQLQSFLFHCAIYLNSEENAKVILASLVQERSVEDQKILRSYLGNFEEWLNNLQRTLNNRTQFMQHIARNTDLISKKGVPSADIDLD